MELKKPVASSANIDSSGSGLVLAANDLAKYRVIGNPTGVGLWLNYTSPALVGSGIYVAPGTGWVINRDNMWKGAVYGIRTSGGAVAFPTMELE